VNISTKIVVGEEENGNCVFGYYNKVVCYGSSLEHRFFHSIPIESQLQCNHAIWAVITNDKCKVVSKGTDIYQLENFYHVTCR